MFLHQDFISFGSGEPPASEYHSFVLYHNNSPRWSELLKLPIPVDKFRGSHIRFEFRHCSSKCGSGALQLCGLGAGPGLTVGKSSERMTKSEEGEQWESWK